MARRVNAPPAGALRCYIPEALGNGSDPEPVRVWLRNPTEAQKRQFIYEARATVALDANGQPEVDAQGNPSVSIDLMRFEGWKRAAIMACLDRVESYERLGEDGSWLPIATAADFVDHAEGDLVDEVALEIVGAFSWHESQKKTSARSSDSTPAVTAPSPGTAPNAMSSDLPAQEAAPGQPPTSVTLPN